MVPKRIRVSILVFAAAAFAISSWNFAADYSGHSTGCWRHPRSQAWRSRQGPTLRAAWQWGEAETLEAAEALSGRLSTETARKEWMQGLREGSTDWEEVKLALSLLWEKAAKEGRDGGPFGYPMALTRLLEGIYDEPDGDEMLIADIDARLTQVPEGDPSDKEIWKRSVVSCCFDELGFLSGGL
ncbi:ASPH [Symbiodinium pilosum]|uniref:ASPH protein n=1 Tax=Symbiodinium pilosum TaxID=2952 RepID=A0A812TAI6_SYMPI|nr:ASPH [Symbiodinium pilosum]